MIGDRVCRVAKDLFLTADGKIELSTIKHSVRSYVCFLTRARPCQGPIWDAVAQSHGDVPSMAAGCFIFYIERRRNVDCTKTDVVGIGRHEFDHEFAFHG